MPRGTDFLCENLECENIGTKISIHGPFPIAAIKDIMALQEIVEDPSLYSNLSHKERDGREYALIPWPNKGNIKPKGIRIQYYVPNPRTIFDVDLIWGADDERIRKILAGEDETLAISKKAGVEVWSIEKLLEKGFPCPSCGKKMKANHWLTNTGVSDWGDPNANKSD